MRPTRFRRAHVLWWPWRSRPVVYLPPGLEGDARARTLRHERVHVRQWTELGRARFLWRYLTDAWVSLAVVAAALALTPWLLAAVPVAAVAPAFKGGRLALEAEAYAESVRWWRERGVRRLTTGEGPQDPVGAYALALRRAYALGPLVPLERCRAAIEAWLV